MPIPTVPILVVWEGDDAPPGLPGLVCIPEHIYVGAAALDGVDSVSEWLAEIFSWPVASWERL